LKLRARIGDNFRKRRIFRRQGKTIFSLRENAGIGKSAGHDPTSLI